MTRKAPKMSQQTIKKLVNNPKTPAGLKAFWKKKLRSWNKMNETIKKIQVNLHKKRSSKAIDLEGKTVDLKPF